MPLSDFSKWACSSSSSVSGCLQSLLWFKEKAGIKHEFLVVQAAPEHGGNPVWVRLDRAAKRAYARTFKFWITSDSSSSTLPADDCACICTDPSSARGDLQSYEVYYCRFQQPLSLRRFGVLLRIFAEESPHYKLPTVSLQPFGYFCTIWRVHESMHSSGKLLVFLLDNYGGVNTIVPH